MSFGLRQFTCCAFLLTLAGGISRIALAGTAQWEFGGSLASSSGQVALEAVGYPGVAGAPGVTFTTSLIDGVSAQVAELTEGTALVVRHGQPANGGGTYLNNYTLIMDVMFPSVGDWISLFQTNESFNTQFDLSAGNDGDWFVNPSGNIGIGGSYGGTVVSGTWYRIALVVDSAAHTFTSYIDGVQVQQNVDINVDGRWSLYNTTNPDPYDHFLLFADETAAAAEMGPVVLNSFQFRDSALSAQDIAGLGGPTGFGIGVAPPGGCEQGYFADNFESYADDAALAAAGWQVVQTNAPLEDAFWTLTNPGGRRNPPTANGSPSTGKFLISDSDFAGGTNLVGSGMSHDVITPGFSTVGGSVVWLHVDLTAQLNNAADAVFDIDVSTDGGATFTNLFRRVSPGSRAAPPVPTVTNADGFFGRLDLDLSVQAANQGDVRLRFRHFEPTDDWFIAIDDLLVDCVPPTQGGNCVGLAKQGFSGSLGAMSTVSLTGNTGTETWHTTDKGLRYVAGAVSGRGVNRLNHPSPTPDFAIQDSDADPDPLEDEYLRTPVINCATYSAVFLHYKSETVVDEQATQDVLLSLDGGATFPITLFSYNQAGGASNALFDGGEEPFYGEFVLPAPAAAGQANAVFAFHYKSPGDRWWWAVDDVMVTGTAPLCVACDKGFFADDFESYADDAGLAAAGWQVVQTNAPAENAAWTVTNPCGRRNPPTLDGSPSTGKFIISDSDCADGSNTPGTGMSHDLITPGFATIGETKVWLHADCSAQLNNNGDAIFDIDVSTDGGVSFTNIFRRIAPGRTAPPTPDVTNADGYFGRLDLDISAQAADKPDVRVRFRQFEPTDDWWVALDNVLIDCVPAPQGGNCEPLKTQSFSGGVGAMSAVSRAVPANTGTETWNTLDKGHRYTPGVANSLGGQGVNRLNQPGPTPDFAIQESQADPDPAEDEFLMTPVLNCTSLTEVFLHYKDETVLANAATQEVLLSIDGGATFSTTIFRYNQAGGANNALFDDGEESMYAERVFSVPAAAGQAKAVFAFHYQSPGNQRFWAVDDVKVTGSAVLCDPCDCGLRNFTVSFDPATSKVTGTFASLPCAGRVMVYVGDRLIADLPGDATSFTDSAPPPCGTAVTYTLRSDRDCVAQPIQTFRCAGGLTCRTDQPAKKVSLRWTPGVNLSATGYELKRNGVAIATLPLTASSFNDTPAFASTDDFGVFNYELSLQGGPGCPCAALACRAILSPGKVCFADDFDGYADDVELELAGWFRVDEITTPPGEDGATWTVVNPGGRSNPPTFDGKASTGRFAISDSDFAGGDNGDPGNGNSNDLWSPTFNTTGKQKVWLHLDCSAQLNNNGKVVFDVDVSTDGGATWKNAFRRVAPTRTEAAPLVDTTNADGFFGRLDVDLSALAANKPNARFRLRSFEPSDDWWIAVDNVIVDDVAPLAGGSAAILPLEDFSSGIPAAWTVRSAVDPENSGITTWNTDDPCARLVPGGVEEHGVNRLTSFALLDSDCDPDPPQDEYLITPALDCTNFTDVFLQWKSEIVVTENTVQEVLLSLDGGATFEPEPVFSYNGGGLFDSGEDPFYASRAFRVPAAVGEGNVAFAFHYKSGGDEWWWGVSDVRVSGTPTGGRQLPGDCNQDGKLDTSDVTCMLQTLFVGDPQKFPCGNGSPKHAANLALLDSNGDDGAGTHSLDLADALYILNYLVFSGPPHVLGTQCLRLEDCPDVSHCPAQ
jgi:hypothetical protein